MNLSFYGLFSHFRRILSGSLDHHFHELQLTIQSVPAGHYESIERSGGTLPLILKHGARCERPALRPRRLNPGERALSVQ